MVFVALLIDIAVFVHSLVLRFLFIGFIVVFVSFGLCFFVSDNIDVGSVNVLQSSHSCVNSVTNSSENSDDFHSVSRLHEIDQIFISAHLQGLWSFTVRNSLRGFLHLDVLFVREHAEVVDHLKREPLIASLTKLWLCDSSSLDEPEFFSMAS